MNRQSGNNYINSVLKTAMGIIIAVFVLLLLGTVLLPPFLLKKINEKQGSDFSVSAARVKVNLLARKIQVDSIVISETGIRGNQVSVQKLQLRGIHYLDLAINKNFKVNRIHILEPKFQLYRQSNGADSTKQSSIQIRQTGFSAKNVTVENASGQITNQNGSGNFSGLTLSLTDFSTTDTSKYNFRSFYFSRVQSALKELRLPVSDSLYTFKLTNLNIDSETAASDIERLSFVSNYSKYKIGQHQGVETDWFNFKVDSLNISDLMIKQMLEKEAFIAGWVGIGKVDGVAFRDKRLPFPSKPDTKLLMQVVDSFPVPLHIDSLKIRNANIKYEEHVKNADKAGVVYFTNLQAAFSQLSNIEECISEQTTLVASGRLMGKALLKANFVMPNKKFENSYQVEGSLEPASFAIINPITKQNLSAELKSGEIKALSFNFQYNNIYSEGWLEIQYSGLKINMLNQKKNTKRVVPTFLFNSVLINKNNLETDKNYKKGKIYFEKDQKKSMFNYWWKSLYSGIKSVVVSDPLN